MESQTRIEEVTLTGPFKPINAKAIEHADASCHARTLAIARDRASGVVVGISCARCAAPQHCSAPVAGGRHGAPATRATPAGWRCSLDADREGWPVDIDGWSYPAS